MAPFDPPRTPLMIFSTAFVAASSPSAFSIATADATRIDLREALGGIYTAALIARQIGNDEANERLTMICDAARAALAPQETDTLSY